MMRFNKQVEFVITSNLHQKSFIITNA